MKALNSAAASIWLVDMTALSDQALASFLPLLGVSEMQRYGRFVRSERQRQFLVGRVLLRQVAGAMLGVPAHALAVTERRGQAPLLALGAAVADDGGRVPALPYFSLSHSGPWVACAVSSHTALGLDIELADSERDIAALAQQAFGPEEAQELAAAPPQAPVAAFYRRWSTQEARYKLGECVAPSCISIEHPELSVVLCSAQPLDSAPLIHPTQLQSVACARQA